MSLTFVLQTGNVVRPRPEEFEKRYSSSILAKKDAERLSGNHGIRVQVVSDYVGPGEGNYCSAVIWEYDYGRLVAQYEYRLQTLFDSPTTTIESTK